MTKQRVLVVDDEPSICWAFEKMLAAEGHHVVTASSAEEGLREAKRQRFGLVVLDVRLPRQDGLSALPSFLSATDDAPVIVITAFGDLETAVAAVKRGATDYLTKPIKLEDALHACRSALQDRPRTETSSGKAAPSSVKPSTLVGQSAAMQQVFRQIALVAESDLSVLITGETGTGKELVAEAIHRHSDRALKPYLPIAPVALNPDLVESELFGHVRGAFTGAGEDRAGLFEQAEGGTVLLDEIGDLPLSVQVKLLRVLEQGEYTRVGEIQPRHANVRILAATNCDLHQAVTRGDFREDLFHRMTGMQIQLPPLRQRAEDLQALCLYFLDAMGYEHVESAVDETLLSALRDRPWHGNVRELRSAIEHAAVIARGRPLRLEDFPAPKPKRGESTEPSEASLEAAIEAWSHRWLDGQRSDPSSMHGEFLAATEPALFRMALAHTQGNRAKAAELLGIHRGTLRERLKMYGLDEERRK
ncbi:MAG: sigma-54 dependent transcriptional regulator [Planctomycetota bacterium]